MSELRSLDQFIQQTAQSGLLRLSTAGSVDDGKSTLIGRLLRDSKNVYEDQLNALRGKSKGSAEGEIDLALLTDGLKAEVEQGITIDVAYRYFSTPKRRFILADTPGHEQYTRNMATGASTADLTIILADARKGIITQTRRHAFIATLMGVPRLLVAVNKMDLVDYRAEVFEQIREDFTQFAAKLGVKELRFIPISALRGDNVVQASGAMPWYQGETVMQYLENVYVGGDLNLVDFRFPVQLALRPHQNFRGYAGQVASGSIRVGEEVVVLPSMRRTKIKSITGPSLDEAGAALPEASAKQSVTLTLEDEVDVGRGDMLVRSHNIPQVTSQFEAMIVWMNEQPMDLSKRYVLRHSTRETKVQLQHIHYRIDVNTLSRSAAQPLELNEVGRVSCSSTSLLFLDPYQRNRATGCFILVDPDNFRTLAAGLVIDRVPTELREHEGGSNAVRSQFLHQELGAVTRMQREQRAGAPARTLWFTGLSGSGKSTLAKELELRLFQQGRMLYRLDGDNLRSGLNRDLGFSSADRSENIRRVAEVARLMNDAGLTVICSFISPFTKDRELAREIIGADNFLEIYLATPLAECEKRDPHGLYRKARQGEVQQFTGLSSPYEAPLDPALTLDTAAIDLAECVEQLVTLAQKGTKLC
jgi:bifunctional enzyme CysN/CysC